MAILFLLVTFLLVVLVGYAMLLLIRMAAEKNIFLDKLEEGTSVAYVAGEKGALIDLKWQFRDHDEWSNGDILPLGQIPPEVSTLSATADHVPPSDAPMILEERSQRTTDSRDWKDRLGLTGVKWMGIPGLITPYTYEQLEPHLDSATSTTGEQVKVTIERVKRDFFPLKDDVYYALLLNVETVEKITLNIGLLLTMVIVNPRKLFKVDKWLETLSNQILGSFRRLVGNVGWDVVQEVLGHNFIKDEIDLLIESIEPLIDDESTELSEETRRVRRDVRKKQISKAIKDLQELVEEIRERYGVSVLKIQVGPIDPTGPRAAELAAAGSKDYEARREAIRIRREYQEVGSHEMGAFIRFSEALETVSKGAGSTIIPFPVELGGIMSAMGRSKDK